MRKHVKPADPAATIPDPDRGRDLPPEGQVVGWTPYWAGLASRGDVIVSDVADADDPQGDPPTASDHEDAPSTPAEPEPESNSEPSGG